MRLLATTLLTLLAGSACTPQEQAEAWQAYPTMNQWGEPNGNGKSINSPQVAPAGPSHLGPTWRKGHPHQDILARIVIVCLTDARGGAPSFIVFNQEVTLAFGDEDLEHTLAARIDGRDVTYKAIQYPAIPDRLQLFSGPELLQELDKARKDIAFVIDLKVGGYAKFTWPLTGYAEAREEACGQP